MKCKLCGRNFEPHNSQQKYCSQSCSSKYQNNFTRSEEFEKVQRREEKEKRFEKWIEEAAQCGMSYGQYRAAREFFGKTFEELRL